MNQTTRVSLVSCASLIIGSITCLFFSCGLLMTLGLSPVFTERADKVEGLPTNADIALGEETVLTGVLGGEVSISSDPDVPNIQDYNLLVYQVEEYKRSTSNRNRTGTWTTIRREIGSNLTLQVNASTIHFEGDDSISLNGEMEVISLGDGLTSDGDIRLRGFRSGATVTIVAERTSEEQFVADEIYGGSRDALISNTRLGASIARYLGYGFMCISAAVGLFFALIFFLILRKRQPPEPEIAYP